MSHDPGFNMHVTEAMKHTTSWYMKRGSGSVLGQIKHVNYKFTNVNYVIL